MKSEHLFVSGCVAAKLTAGSKKQLLHEMAEMAVRCGAASGSDYSACDVLGAVMERERLGSTGVGAGVAIPHARLDGIEDVKAVFARLETPVDYESVDDRPVDLAVLLLAPKEADGEHLKALAQVSRLLRREDMRAKLRSAPDAESLHLLLTGKAHASAA